MRQLKLNLAYVDKSIGKISYSIEDARGNRVDFAEYKNEHIKNYDFQVMDLFLLSYLPKLMSLGDSLLVRGPISKVLSIQLMLFQDKLIGSKIYPFSNVNVFFETIKRVNPNTYYTEGIVKIAKAYFRNENLNESLEEAFKNYS